MGRALPPSCVAFSASLLLGASGPARADDPAIVFASRVLEPAPKALERRNAIDLALSGRLLLRTSAGEVKVLVDSSLAGAPPEAPLDVTDPEVSYLGDRIVFAGFSGAEGSWRIYEVGADGLGLRQLTRSDRQVNLDRYGEAAARFRDYDDTDPCYLPDGRICFVSTRYPEVAPDGRLRSTNLYVVERDGSGLHRITSERFGADAPTVDPATGRIVYSRWWRTAQTAVDPRSVPEPIPPGSPGYGDPGQGNRTGGVSQRNISLFVLRGIQESLFPGVNNWFTASVNPDGTGLSMVSGAGLDRERTQAYRPSFAPDGSIVALFIPSTPFLGFPGENGLRRFRKGSGDPESLGGQQAFRESDPGKADKIFRYSSASAMPDGRLLVTGFFAEPLDAGGRPAARGNSAIYVQEKGQAAPALVFQETGRDELDAVLLIARPLPPVISDQAVDPLLEEAPRTVEEAFARGSFTFRSENIFFNASVDSGIPAAPPVGKRLSIEFFMAPQRTGTEAADPPIRIARQEIGPDGRIEVTLPSGVPLFELLRRPDGKIALGRDGQIFHVGGMNFNRSGQKAACVGCHAGHTMIEVPADASWTNLAPSATVTASSSRQDFGPEFLLFQPKALVDRRTTPAEAEWAAVPGAEEYRVQLRWTVTIRARQAVVHGTIPGKGILGPRDQTVKAFTLRTLLGERVQEEKVVGEAARPEGTVVPLSDGKEFDGLEVRIRAQDVTGLFEGVAAPALAEIQVLAQVAGPATPVASFIRGDADCSRATNLTDAITILATLFQGQDTLCCQSAADANSDDRLDIGDSIFLLDYLFLGANSPAEPFPQCGPGTGTGSLTCENDTCAGA
jgi:hypothetical protein